MLQVIGAGFGRTGTLSMKLALEQLGFAKCYHMLEVAKHPEHLALWSQATEDAAKVNWPALFVGYRSAVDWPVAAFWRELAVYYPDSKIILTRRDGESWYRSAYNTIYQHMLGMNEMRSSISPTRMQGLQMAKRLILDKGFSGRFADKGWAIKTFEAHNQKVIDTIAPERLLVYELGCGWQPLCSFLDRPVPDAAYPKVNTAEDFLHYFPKPGTQAQ